MGFQEFLERRQLGGHEPQAVHPGVELDMDRERLDSAFPENRAEGFERLEIRNSGFEPAVDYLGKEVASGREHEYRQRYSVAPELHTFDRQGHSQIVGAFRLQHGGELHGSVAVGVGLHEHQQTRRGPEQRAEISIVVSAGRDAEFQPREVIFVVHVSV